MFNTLPWVRLHSSIDVPLGEWNPYYQVYVQTMLAIGDIWLPLLICMDDDVDIDCGESSHLLNLGFSTRWQTIIVTCLSPRSWYIRTTEVSNTSVHTWRSLWGKKVEWSTPTTAFQNLAAYSVASDSNRSEFGDCRDSEKLLEGNTLQVEPRWRLSRSFRNIWMPHSHRKCQGDFRRWRCAVVVWNRLWSSGRTAGGSWKSQRGPDRWSSDSRPKIGGKIIGGGTTSSAYERQSQGYQFRSRLLTRWRRHGTSRDPAAYYVTPFGCVWGPSRPESQSLYYTVKI